MKSPNKAFIWREFHRDFRSFNIIVMYLLATFFAFYFYWINKDIIQYVFILQNTLLVISIYTSKYGMNNIMIILSLPVSYRQQSQSRTFYTFIKIIVLSIFNILIALIINNNSFVEMQFKEFCHFVILDTLSVICLFYFSFLLLICFSKRLFIFVIIIVSTFLNLLQNMMLNNIYSEKLIIPICFLLFFITNIKLKYINAEKLVRRWN